MNMNCKNGNISHRQIFRLFVFDLMGIGTLLLPPYLAALCGPDGIWAIFLGTLLGLVYLLYLGWVRRKMGCDLLTYLKEQKGPVIRGIALGALGMHTVFAGGFCAMVLVRLVRNSLVEEQVFGLLLLVVVLTAVYAVSGGLESRARVYEILFFFVLIPYILMVATSVRTAKAAYFDTLLSAPVGNLAKGIYLVFLLLTPLFFVLLLPWEPRERAGKCVGTVAKAVGLTAFILLGSYILLVGNFGSASLSKMRFPIVTLMSTVQFEGTFLKRMDAFMVAIWFFTLFALLNLHLHYSVCVCKTLQKRQTRMSVWTLFVPAVLVYGVAFLMEFWEDGMGLFLKYYSGIAVPLVVIGPLLLLLCGCAATELEEKAFPLLVVADYEEDRRQVVFGAGFPRLDNSADSNGKTGKLEVKTVYAPSFSESKRRYEADLNKVADYNHLKVLVLGEDMAKNPVKLRDMLSFLAKNNTFPRNTYVCIVDDISDLLELDKELTQDIGTYLEEYLHNHREEQTPATLGSLIDEMYNQKFILKVPYLEVEEGYVTRKGDWEIKIIPVE